MLGIVCACDVRRFPPVLLAERTRPIIPPGKDGLALVCRIGAGVAVMAPVTGATAAVAMPDPWADGWVDGLLSIFPLMPASGTTEDEDELAGARWASGAECMQARGMPPRLGRRRGGIERPLLGLEAF